MFKSSKLKKEAQEYRQELTEKDVAQCQYMIKCMLNYLDVEILAYSKNKEELPIIIPETCIKK